MVGYLPFMNALAALGRWVLDGFSHIGRLSYFVVEGMRGLSEVRIWWPRMMVEAWNIGAGSLFIVMLISAFAGAVTALQTGYQFTGSIPYYVVGTLVTSSIILELGPVLTALILAGRIGARYAAELGTMRVTEQIDALESLGRSPASHLVVPRVLAGLIMIPALTVLANLSGVVSGWLSVKAVLPVTDADFIYGAQYYWRPWDAYYSIIKAFFFAGSITVIACYMGFNTQQGAEGVGRSTTTAVVTSSVLILVLDTVLTRLLLNQ
jgi:phospholipid/cholesterol/gamma-HCH transport system permease protein